ncbi:VOC family protein [Gallaecimonas xiamenensis]|uniref:Ehpr protein n=1 Tax=Gallaecimonas xiamenensis 3-C-1 TaxID=745411 RepID=K2IZ41_9GAMM|nr:VOC family protein [Gallaecimonas xiamenensis]EKE75751.1 ehpr protein [Gallaecimonas xiamenensis 3-C-1]
MFYVADVVGSGRFYQRLLGKAPVEQSEGFCLFLWEGGTKFGLWRQDLVQPPVTAPSGSGEIGIALGSRAEVDALYQDWVQLGLEILQAPELLGFGYSLTAADPDGNRIRAYHLENQ